MLWLTINSANMLRGAPVPSYPRTRPSPIHPTPPRAQANTIPFKSVARRYQNYVPIPSTQKKVRILSPNPITTHERIIPSGLKVTASPKNSTCASLSITIPPKRPQAKTCNSRLWTLDENGGYPRVIIHTLFVIYNKLQAAAAAAVSTIYESPTADTRVDGVRSIISRQNRQIYGTTGPNNSSLVTIHALVFYSGNTLFVAHPSHPIRQINSTFSDPPGSTDPLPQNKNTLQRWSTPHTTGRQARQGFTTRGLKRTANPRQPL